MSDEHAPTLPSDETVGDIEAIRAEIHDRVTEQADRFDFEDGAATRQALLDLIGEAQTAVSLLETTILGQLEASGSRQIDKLLFKRKPNRVERFRHDSIKAAVAKFARVAACDDDGVVSPARAVDFAVQAMADLYVSPSTTAKTGGLSRVGLSKTDVTDLENKGYKLEVEDLA